MLAEGSLRPLGDPLDERLEWRSLIIENVVFFQWFYNKNENLWYHGTGSEESAREPYADNMKERVCLSSHGGDNQSTNQANHPQPNGMQAAASKQI